MLSSKEYEWAGRSLAKLLKKAPVDAAERFLYLLQEWNRPSEVLELINSLRDCGVLITLGDRKRDMERRKVLGNNAKKARAAKRAR